VPIRSTARISAGGEYQVNIRILAMILVIARTDYQQLGVAQRSVLQAMPISNAGLESRTVSRLQ
jgi:hypothetical protein